MFLFFSHIFDIPHKDVMQMYKKGYHNFRISNDTFNPFHQTIEQFPHKKYTSPKIFPKLLINNPHTISRQQHHKNLTNKQSNKKPPIFNMHLFSRQSIDI